MPRIITLDDLLDQAEQQARAILVDAPADTQLIPTYVLVTAADECLILGCPWGDDTEKTDTLDAIRKIALDYGGRIISFLGEAWVKKIAPGDVDDGVRPSQALDRIEVAMALATDGFITRGRSWNIVRGTNGSVAELVLLSEGYDTFAGPLIDGLLPVGSRA